MWKFLFMALAGFIVYKLFTNDMQRKSRSAETERRREQERMASVGEMVKDPVCGAYVSNDADIRVRDGQSVHCFCSYECRDAYLERIGVKSPDSGESKRS